jgi:hypothetical protein
VWTQKSRAQFCRYEITIWAVDNHYVLNHIVCKRRKLSTFIPKVAPAWYLIYLVLCYNGKKVRAE